MGDEKVITEDHPEKVEPTTPAQPGTPVTPVDNPASPDVGTPAPDTRPPEQRPDN
jgi:hypothetical protein